MPRTTMPAPSESAHDDLRALRNDLAASTARERALQAKIKTLTAQNAELPALRARFDSLVAAHQSSKVQRQEIARNLRNELRADGQALKTAEIALLESVEAHAALVDDVAQSDLAARTLVHSLRGTIEALEDRLAGDALAARTRSLRLERRVDDRDAQVAELVRLVETLEDERDELLSAVYDLDLVSRHLLEEAAHERDERRRTLKASDERTAGWKARALAAETELAVARSRVDELTDAHALDTLLAASRCDALAEDLTIASDRCVELETEADEADRARIEAEAARERTATLLAQSRVAESALAEDLASAEESLQELDGLREAHVELQRTLSSLLARSTLAEHDAAALASLNAQLAGHANHSQKVRHLERVRSELAEYKRRHLKSTAELESARAEAVKLRRELDSYTAIETSKGGKAGSTRAIRPALADLVNAVTLDHGRR